MNAPAAHPHALVAPIPDPLPPAVVRKLSVLSTRKALMAIAAEWLMIAGAIALCSWLWHPLLYLATVVFIGARQHALAVIGHDAAHYRLLPSRALNDWVGDLLVQWPIFLHLEGFRHFHGEHHRYLGAPADGNRQAWKTHTADGQLRPEWRYPRSLPGLLWTLLGRGAGPTGLWWMVRTVFATLLFRRSWGQVAVRAVYSVAVVGLLYQLGWLWGAFLYWVVPYCTWHIIAQYMRLICEHSAIPEREGGYAHTRTTLARAWERWLIVPRNIHYHVEHHWYPSVPFYNLPDLHAALVAQPGFARNAVIAPSVMAALGQCLRPAGAGAGVRP